MAVPYDSTHDDTSAMEIVKIIGHRIKQARKASRMTQAQLAERLGVDQTTVGRYERGVREVSLDVLYAMATLLKADLLGANTGEEPERVKRLIDLYENLDDRGKDTVFRVAEAQSVYGVGRGAKGEINGRSF